MSNEATEQKGATTGRLAERGKQFQSNHRGKYADQIKARRGKGKTSTEKNREATNT